jgi:DNA replication ATP-dependent helicase Dna2
VFDVGIIDEASQVLLPHLIGVLRLVKKFILVGDHNQLPPVIKSKQAEELKKTLFEQLFERDYKEKNIKVILDIQYRMPEAISTFISNEFYKGQLTASPDTAGRKLKIAIDSDHPVFDIINPKMPLTLVNVGSTMSSLSPRTSPKEAEMVLKILTALFELDVKPDEIGIIAPFRAQVAEIRRKIENNLSSYFDDRIKITKI